MKKVQILTDELSEHGFRLVQQYHLYLPKNLYLYAQQASKKTKKDLNTILVGLIRKAILAEIEE